MGTRRKKIKWRNIDYTKVKSFNSYLGQRENVQPPVRQTQHEKSCQDTLEDDGQALSNHLQEQGKGGTSH